MTDTPLPKGIFEASQKQLGVIYRRVRAKKIRDHKRRLKHGPEDRECVDEDGMEEWEDFIRVELEGIHDSVISRFFLGSSPSSGLSYRGRRYYISQRTCDDCEEKYYEVHTAQLWKVWCEDCEADRARERKRELRLYHLPPPPSPMKCDHCGTKFQPKSHTTRTRFCTSACRQAAYRDRVATS